MNLLRVTAAVALVTALAACETTQGQPEPVVVTQVVERPVAVRCSPQVGPRPVLPDTDAAILAASGIQPLAALLAAGRLLRDAYIQKLEAAVAECRGTQGN